LTLPLFIARFAEKKVMGYTGTEIINLAVNIEKNRYELYQSAAKKIKRKNDLKNIFLDLAEKEAEHQETFKRLAEQYELENNGFSDPITNDHVNHTGFDHLFSNPSVSGDITGKIKTPKEALEIALMHKDENIRFFNELAKETEGNTKNLIYHIIAQEKLQAEMIRRFL
jgi:rubrerythrin